MMKNNFDNYPKLQKERGCYCTKKILVTERDVVQKKLFKGEVRK